MCDGIVFLRRSQGKTEDLLRSYLGKAPLAKEGNDLPKNYATYGLPSRVRLAEEANASASKSKERLLGTAGTEKE